MRYFSRAVLMFSLPLICLSSIAQAADENRDHGNDLPGREPFEKRIHRPPPK